MVFQFIAIATAVSGALMPILVTMGLVTVGTYLFASVIYPALLLAGILGIAVLSYTEGRRLKEPNQRAIFTLGVPMVMLGFGMITFLSIKLPFLSVVGVSEQTFTPMTFSLAEPLSSVSVPIASSNILILLVLTLGVTLMFRKQLIKQAKGLFKSMGLKL